MPLLSLTALLLFTLAPACKRSGAGLDLITSSVRYVHVGDEVALTLNSTVAKGCSATVNSRTIQCEKISQDNNTYYASLGVLTKDSAHPIELEINSDNTIKHALKYRYKTPSKTTSHYLRLDLQSKVAEIQQTKTSSFPSLGCKVANQTKPKQLTPMPLRVQRLITTGFGNASASHHARNKNVARIFYSGLNFSSDWDIYLMEQQVGTRFILPSPAKLERVSIGNTPIGSDLDKQEQIIPISHGDVPKFYWQIKNPAPRILLTLKIARDDRSIVGECWVDANQGVIELEPPFWQQLTAGKYSVEALLITPQRVVIQDDSSAIAWQVNAYDWRYGYFSKT